MKLPRDVFIESIFDAAVQDKNIHFLSADFGAKALDRFRTDLKDQFLHMGICEQNMINVGEGLALCGNKVYCYAMDCFVAIRALEQLKVASISIQLEKEKPTMNIVGVGPGFGYGDAGPTHYTTEMIGCLRGIADLEILSPSDANSVKEAARISHTKPGFRYIRLDRKHLPDIYSEGDKSFSEVGMSEIRKGERVCLVASGFMTHTALEVKKKLGEKGIDAGIVDIFRIAPFNEEAFIDMINKYDKIVTLEEHFLSGGLGEMIARIFANRNVSKDLKTIGVDQKYYFENASDHKEGSRIYIHSKAGIGVDDIVRKIS